MSSEAGLQREGEAGTRRTVNVGHPCGEVWQAVRSTSEEIGTPGASQAK